MTDWHVCQGDSIEFHQFGRISVIFFKAASWMQQAHAGNQKCTLQMRCSCISLTWSQDVLTLCANNILLCFMLQPCCCVMAQDCLSALKTWLSPDDADDHLPDPDGLSQCCRYGQVWLLSAQLMCGVILQMLKVVTKTRGWGLLAQLGQQQTGSPTLEICLLLILVSYLLHLCSILSLVSIFLVFLCFFSCSYCFLFPICLPLKVRYSFLSIPF